MSKQIESEIDLNQKFYVFDNFITSNKDILERGDADWDSSKIFFQLSVEHADNSPLSYEAEEFEEDGKVDWDYLKDINRREKYIINPLISMIKISDNIESLEISRNEIMVYTQNSTLVYDKENLQKINILDTTKKLEKNKLELESVESHKYYIPLKNGDLFCYGGLVDRDVIIRDGKTLEEKTIIKGHGGSPVYLQELSNGDIATVSYQRAFRILRDYKEIYKIDELHNDEVLGFYYEEDKDELFTYAKNKTIKKWKVDLLVNTLEQENLKNLAICNDFKDFILMSGVGINKLDRETYKIVDTYLEHSAPFSSIAKINEKYFAAATFDKKIFIFDIDSFDVIDVLTFVNEKIFIPQIKVIAIDDKYLVFTPIGTTAYLLDKDLNAIKANKDDYKEQTKYKNPKNVSHDAVKIEDAKITYKDSIWFSDKLKELQVVDDKRDVVCIKDGKKSIKFLKLIPAYYLVQDTETTCSNEDAKNIVKILNKIKGTY